MKLLKRALRARHSCFVRSVGMPGEEQRRPKCKNGLNQCTVVARFDKQARQALLTWADSRPPRMQS